MKFIHTSDWHLGRIFYGIRLTEDQAVVLAQLIRLIKDERPDLVILSGDVYDRAVPPPEAVDLLDDVLSRIILDVNIPVLLISGNHDNPRRLGFGSRILKSRGLYLRCSLHTQPEPVTFHDKYGKVNVFGLPFADPPEIREVFKDETLHSHNSAMKAIIGKIKTQRTRGVRTIVAAHTFAAGGEESESERPLSIGGIQTVDSSLFSCADYTALGHLHKYQKIGDKEVYYSGSLLKYSFSESEHIKSVQVVEMDGEGACVIKRIPLTPKRDVRCIEGYFADLLKPGAGTYSSGSVSTDKASSDTLSTDDYIMATVLDQGVILDVMSRLREKYPNLLHIRKPSLETDSDTDLKGAQHRKLGEKELFKSFITEVTGEEISEEQIDEFDNVTEKLKKQERTE
ncbi:MAG: exonuclease SbcCD subunit D [Spirochaetales bacterium]|nr:exonuclease SbcCD subunit D [Spirochaetales bacterium]